LATSGNGTIHIALGVFSNAMLFVADKIVELKLSIIFKSATAFVANDVILMKS
jgi:hypothetical protein